MPRGSDAERTNKGGAAAEPILSAAWAEGLKEPTKLVGLAYFWVVAVGFAHLFGSGMAFKINVIDLASPSDFLVAGLRDPLVTGLAAATGWGLYKMWGQSLHDPRYRRALVPTAVALLLVGAVCSAMYRHAVVSGALKDSWIAPLPLVVTTDDAPPLTNVRMAVTTSDFLILGGPDDRAIVLPKGRIKRIDLK